MLRTFEKFTVVLSIVLVLSPDTDILYKDEDNWILIGDETNDLRGSNLFVSNKYKNGFKTIFYNGQSWRSEKEDKFVSNKYKCRKEYT